MGSGGGAFDVADRVTADRLNRKMLFIGTGAEINALTPTPGMLAFCTSTGSGFVADTTYRRNAANSAWEQVLDEIRFQDLFNKTINTDQNTIKDSATNNAGDILVNNGTKFARKARGTAYQIPRMNSGGTDLEFVPLAHNFGAGDVLVASADTERNPSVGTNYTLVKSIKLGGQGTLRIKFDIKETSGSQTYFAKIYRNGSPVGTERSTTSSTYATFSEDLAGWSDGDTCEVYVKSSVAGPTNTGYIRNFRVSVDKPGDPGVLTD